MKLYRYNRQEFAECLVKGFDWKTRCDRIGAAVEEVLDQTPGDKFLRAGDLTSLILKAYEYKRDRQHPEFKAVRNVITAIGKTAEYKQHISIGKEIRCGNKPDGSPRYARERLWRGTEHADLNVELPLPADLAPAEDKSTIPTIADAIALLELGGYTVLEPGNKSTEGMWMAIPMSELKDHPEQFAVFKEWVKENTGVDMDSVQGVDNKKFSKHPSPGAARVDCGECGGSGKVYMKQEPT